MDLEEIVFGGKVNIAEEEEEPKAKKAKAPVWVDPDDLSVIIKPELQTKEGQSYSDFLREKFAQATDGIDASWALQSDETSKPQTIDGSSVFSDDSSHLPSDILHITRIANLFESTKERVRINDLVFDPSQSQAAVLDNKGSVHFMAVNPKRCAEQAVIHASKIPRLCICYTKDGTKLIAGCGRGNFHVIDCKTYEVDIARIPDANTDDLKHVYCSPDNRTLIMLTERKVHFLDCQTRRVIKSISVSDILFCGDFSDDGSLFIAAGANGYGIIFNVETKTPIKRFQEPERQNIKSIAISRGRVAIGTEAGVLHVFDIDSIQTPHPIPLFTKMNLTTVVDTVVFHQSGEMLVFASSGKKDSLRVLHIGARKVFSNWPTKQTPLSYVRKVAFDAKGQFLSFGTDKGSCLLWELPFFAQ